MSPSPRREASQLTKALCFTHRSFDGEIECTTSGILVFILFLLPGLFFLYMQFVLSTCFISNNRTGSNLAYENTTVCHYFLSPKALAKQDTELFEECTLALSCQQNTGLFISPSGISELDCATTKTHTAERSISIGRESLEVFFFCTRGLGVLPGSTARG